MLKNVIYTLGRYQSKEMYRLAFVYELRSQGYDNYILNKEIDLMYKSNSIGQYTFDFYFPDHGLALSLFTFDVNLQKELENFKNKIKLITNERITETFFVNLDSKGNILVSKIQKI